MVRYQQLKAMAGTHDVKNRSEGRAHRQEVRASRRARAAPVTATARRRSSAVAAVPSVPTPRSHAIDLPKKVRALALKHALSAKAKAGEMIDRRQRRAPRRPRPRRCAPQFGKLEWANALIIDGAEVDQNFALAARNIPQIDVLPVQGINVVDILRRHKLVLTKAACSKRWRQRFA